MGNKNYKLFIPFLNINTIKRRNNIEFSKNFSVINSVEGFFN